MFNEANILVAEDDPTQAENIRRVLAAEGYHILIAADGRQAQSLIEADAPDLLVTAWLIPEISGIQLLRYVRSHERTMTMPVIMVTKRAYVDDRLYAFECGVDDYITKPFIDAELVARTKALLNRTRPEIYKDQFSYCGIVLNKQTQRVCRDGQLVPLAHREFMLLMLLLSHPGQIIKREQIIEHVWGKGLHVETQTLNVVVKRLRDALNANGKPNLIRTHRGVGYSISKGF